MATYIKIANSKSFVFNYDSPELTINVDDFSIFNLSHVLVIMHGEERLTLTRTPPRTTRYLTTEDALVEQSMFMVDAENHATLKLEGEIAVRAPEKYDRESHLDKIGVMLDMTRIYVLRPFPFQYPALKLEMMLVNI